MIKMRNEEVVGKSVEDVEQDVGCGGVKCKDCDGCVVEDGKRYCKY